MKQHHFAKIAIRILALFLVYRGLEFGVTQMLQCQLLVGAIDLSGQPIDPKTSEAIKVFWIMTGIGAIAPAFLAGVLWFVAPILSRWMAGTEENCRFEDDGLPLRAMLIQGAAIIMIAMAASTLPKLAYDLQVDYRTDPSITLVTSRVFPDAIQFFAKIFVGGIMLLMVKKKLLPRPSQHAEQAAASGGESPSI